MKKTINNSRLISAIRVLGLAFDANVTAHNYVELSQKAFYNCDHDSAKRYSSLKQESYDNKDAFIKKAIFLIKKYRLPIKYGQSDGVIYFAYNGKQISFHNFSYMVKNIKPYNGKRNNRVNNKFTRL